MGVVTRFVGIISHPLYILFEELYGVREYTNWAIMRRSKHDCREKQA